ncbi:amidohydrolase [Cytophagales bacterium RKSG123]|nr:amidohydrolase [Xanthovirga aplysinae]
MKDKLIKNATILTMNSESEIIEKGYIIIKDNKITEIGEGEPPKFSGLTIDAKGQFLMPGFVNTHSHIPMTIFRGIADDLPLEEWLNNYIWPVENKFLTEETVALGTRLGLVEMIRSGTTCFNDMYFYTESIAQEVESAGMRAVIGEGLLEFPTASYQTIEEAFAITKEFIEKWNGHEIIHPAVSPHAIYTSSPETLKKAYNIAESYDVPYHIHISESRNEVEQAKKEKGESPVQYLDRLGVLSERTIGAHCVWLDEDDMVTFQKRGVNVSHNISSNLKLASGIAPIPQYLDKNINVAIGTDGAASNNNLDMLEETHLAALVHKGNSLDPEVVDALTAMKMATINGAKALGLEKITGSLEVGKRADMILIETNHSYMVPNYNPYSTLIYSANSGAVSTVMVDGKLLMHDKKLMTLNEEAIFEEVNHLKQAIQNSLKKSE